MNETDSIWFPLDFSKWEDKKLIIIYGVRGMGKTAILNAFNWHNRIHDNSLIKLLNGDPFEKGYIGIYLNVPDFINSQFNNWIDNKEYYSLYLECQTLQLLISAIEGLRSKRVLLFSPNNESEVVKSIFSMRPELRFFLKKRNEGNSLDILKSCFIKMHENILFCANENKKLQQKSNYPYLQTGEILKKISYTLLSLCSKHGVETEESTKKWKLKICIDLNKIIESYQQQAISNLISELKDSSDISFVIASRNKQVDKYTICGYPESLNYADSENYKLCIYNNICHSKEQSQPMKELVLKKIDDIAKVYITNNNILVKWIMSSLFSYFLDLNISHNENINEFRNYCKYSISMELAKIKEKFSVVSRSSKQINYTKLHPKEAFEWEVTPILFPTYLIEILQLELQNDIPKRMHEIYLTQNSSISDKIKQRLINENQKENVITAEKDFKAKCKEFNDNNCGRRIFDSLYINTANLYFNSPSSKDTNDLSYNKDLPLEDVDVLEDYLKVAKESLCINTCSNLAEGNKIMIRFHKIYGPKFKSYNNFYCKFSINRDAIKKIYKNDTVKTSDELNKNLYSELFEIHDNNQEV